jgi:hypothetical protein
MNKFIFSTILLCVSTFGYADTQYSIGTPNTDVAPYPGPYASVNVHLINSTNAEVTFTSLTNGNYIYLIGSNAAAAVNVNATSWVISSITGSNTYIGFTPGPFSDNGSANISAFGIMNQTVKSFGGFKNSATTVDFILSNTSGTWADSSLVLANNAKGFLAAAHIFVWDGVNEGALVTGFAANGNIAVPEPSTWLILGSILGVSMLLSRRKLTA